MLPVEPSEPRVEASSTEPTLASAGGASVVLELTSSAAAPHTAALEDQPAKVRAIGVEQEVSEPPATRPRLEDSSTSRREEATEISNPVTEAETRRISRQLQREDRAAARSARVVASSEGNYA